MAIFEFREMKQERGETLNAFYCRLKEKATRCQFHDEDREIKTHIIHKTTDSRLRRKALRETMTLNELLTYGNTLEKTDIESKKIERTQECSSPSNQAYSLHNKQRHQQQRSRYNAQAKNQQKTPSGARHRTRRQCRNCGGQFPHEGGKTKCPAYDKTCHQCNKIGHFAKHCLSGPKKAAPKDDKAKVRQLKTAMTSSSEEDSEEEFIFTISNSQKQPTVPIQLGDITVAHLLSIRAYQSISSTMIHLNDYNQLINRSS